MSVQAPELVCLLEEESAREMLKGLLPRLLPDGWHCRYVVFEGKQDVMQNLTRKIRGYQNQQARFLVLRDLDSHPNCAILKAELVALCRHSGRLEAALVRLACRELESFYLADLAAVEAGLSLQGVATQQMNRKYRAPDYLESPSKELARLTANRYQKISGSREIGKWLALENERSASFRNLLSGIRRLITR